MTNRIAVLFAAASLTLALGVAQAPAAPVQKEKKERTVDVQLLAFNDFHGNLEPPSGSNGEIRVSNSPIQTVKAGGAAYLATHVDRLRAAWSDGAANADGHEQGRDGGGDRRSFVVSAGDLIGASPLLSGLFHDEPTIEAMNLIGLDVNGVGNHEFDEGKQELARMQLGGCHPVDGCQDGTPFYGSVFQFLAANVVDRSTRNPLLPAFEIKNVKGTKIAFIGETLEGTPQIVTPAGVEGLDFLDEADTVNMLVPRLQRRGVETFVLLLHQGGFQSGQWLYNDCNGLGGEILDIVHRLDPAVDVVVSAHTHQPYNCRIDGKLVTSASSFGRIITDISLKLDRRTGDVVQSDAVNRIVTRDVPPDAEIEALVQRYNTIAGPIRFRVVGKITQDIVRAQNAAGESPLGDVIADAQLAATSPTDFGGAKVAFMNPGGIRADLTFATSPGGEPAGDITYDELFTVQPFANTLIVKTCTGQQVHDLLEQQFQVNRILQVSAGFAYSWDSTKPVGDRIDPASITIDGQPVDPGAGYRVTMNSFLATGGDGFTTFTQCTNQLGGAVDIDALASYFASQGTVQPGPANRIQRLP